MAHAHSEAPHTEGRTIRWWARFYDAATWLMTLGRAPAIRRVALEMADVRPGESVLDVGCGTGSLALAAKETAGPDGLVRGIDASPEMIAQARRKASKAGVDAGFEVAPIEELPFGKGEFDVVLSSFMLHHLPEGVKRAGLAEVRRVLKPGGRFLAIDFSGTNQSIVGHMLSIFGHAHAHGARLEALAPVMEEVGFAEVETGVTKYRSVAYLLGRVG